MMKQSVGVLVKSLETFGGGERVAVNLCNALKSMFDVHLIQFYKNESVYPVSGSVKQHFVDQKKERLRNKAILYIYRLRTLIKQLDLDVLIVVGKFSWPIIAMVGTLRLPVKIIFWEQGTLEAAQHVRDTLKKKLFGFFQQQCINYRSDMIVTLTDKERKNYEHKFPRTKNKILSIYNFIKIDESLPIYSSESKQIISVGRIDYAKGYEYLLGIAGIVMPDNPDWQWHIYGDGNKAYVSLLQNKIDSLGLSKQVILKGSHSHILDIYSQYSFLVFTSRFEGFGLVLLEAMSKGLPLISFDIYSGPSDMIRHGENGYLAEPFDVHTMASYVQALITDRDLRLHMHMHSHDNIVDFSEDIVIKRWIDLINKISL